MSRQKNAYLEYYLPVLLHHVVHITMVILDLMWRYLPKIVSCLDRVSYQSMREFTWLLHIMCFLADAVGKVVVPNFTNLTIT